ncbi:MAG: glycosyltransferase family 4 protein, partial [Saprospiraceae bacterium]|nr:glycosyltransferase family 4 protein [Saprospiraceae bacterium]
YQAATYLCPVSEALVASINTYADPSGVGYKIGVLYHIPEVKDKIRVISTDYDSDFWNVDDNVRRGGILALSYIYQEQTFFVKGFDILIECAKLLPDQTFTFAGFSPEMMVKFKNELPVNVTILSFQNKEQARRLYQSHQVFVIPSMTEGLPNTLCEAMLCGCIPVGSEVGAIPQVIGATVSS